MEHGATALAGFAPLKGRGARTAAGDIEIIDESYNANPASMAAALDVLAAASPGRGGRRIAVLGDMLELGEHSDSLHAGLAPGILAAHVDQLILIGEEMAPLVDALDGHVAVARVGSVDQATDALKRMIRPGDAVLIKASNSVGLAKLVESMAKELACST